MSSSSREARSHVCQFDFGLARCCGSHAAFGYVLFAGAGGLFHLVACAAGGRDVFPDEYHGEIVDYLCDAIDF